MVAYGHHRITRSDCLPGVRRGEKHMTHQRPLQFMALCASLFGCVPTDDVADDLGSDSSDGTPCGTDLTTSSTGSSDSTSDASTDGMLESDASTDTTSGSGTSTDTTDTTDTTDDGGTTTGGGLDPEPFGQEVVALPTGGYMWIGHSGHPGPTTLIVVGQHGKELGPLRAVLGWKAGSIPWQGDLAVLYPANPWGVMTGNNTLDPALVGEPQLNLNWGWGPWTGGGGDYPICLDTLDVILSELNTVDYLYDLHSSRARELWTTVNYGHTVMALEDEAHVQSYADAADLAAKLQAVEPEWRAWSPLHPIAADDHPLDVGTSPEEVAWEFEGTLNKAIADAFPWAVSVTVEFPEDVALAAPVVGLFPGESPPQGLGGGKRNRTVYERMLGVLIVLEHAYARHAAP